MKTFSVAAGFSMLMPIPFWDLLLEKMVLYQMIKKVSNEYGLVVSDGVCHRVSGDLINGVMGQQLTGKFFKIFNLSLYVVGGVILNSLIAVGLMSIFEHIVRTHLLTEKNINTLTERKVRIIFLNSLKLT